MSFFQFAGPQTVLHIKNSGRATEIAGQITAIVHKTIVRCKVIKGSHSPSFRFSFFLVSHHNDQYCKTVALCSTHGWTKVKVGFCVTVVSR